MTPWAKIYLKAFKLDVCDDWRCESCNRMGKLQDFDLHHVNSRSLMGGQKAANRIENLMCLCRKCHDEKGDLPRWKAWLFKAHKIFMEQYGVKFDEGWLLEQIQKYDSHSNQDA